MQIIPPASGIKSVQRGTASMISASAISVTVSAVNVAKSSLSISVGGTGASALVDFFVRGTLASSTSIQLNRAGSSSIAVDWELVEYA